jgi:hypothetical protein
MEKIKIEKRRRTSFNIPMAKRRGLRGDSYFQICCQLGLRSRRRLREGSLGWKDPSWRWGWSRCRWKVGGWWFRSLREHKILIYCPFLQHWCYTHWCEKYLISCTLWYT